MRSIPQKGSIEYLYQQRNRARFNDADLYWELNKAILIVENSRLSRWFWDRAHPLCEHDLRHCPLCHTEREYNPRWDHEAPAVQ